MPNPIDLLLDPVSIVVFGIYAALIAWESIAPARPLPAVPRWRLKGAVAFAVFFLLSSYLPLMLGDGLSEYRLFDLSNLGRWGGAAAGLLLYEGGLYIWHRSMHRSTLLWRGFHQMHHSAERLDTFGAFWFSPLDMLGWIALGSVTLTLIIGIAPEAATLVLYITTFLSIFQHANIRTPQWLGYIVQRPESHSYHHERGVHARNYADLPVFDWLFGTFRNPREFAAEAGFYQGASSRLIDMCLFRDVGRPRTPASSDDETAGVLLEEIRP